VWALDANTVFLAGYAGAMYQRSGTSWKYIGATAPAFSFSAITGTSANDVWASGYDGKNGVAVLIHWDGSSWTQQANPASGLFGFFSLWVAGSADVWTVDAKSIYRLRSTGWTTYTPSTNYLDEVWGSSTTDVWTAERTGATSNLMRRWNGSSWASYSTPLTKQTVQLMGNSANDVWATDYDGNVAQFCGSSWTTRGNPGFTQASGPHVVPTAGRIYLLGTINGSSGLEGHFYELK
jgi:hypothetical protein